MIIIWQLHNLFFKVSETGYYPFSKKEKKLKNNRRAYTFTNWSCFRSFLKKLPGFRSNAPLNKYIGSICYTALIAFLLKWMIPFHTTNRPVLYFNRLYASWFTLFDNWFNWTDYCTISNKRKTRAKVFYLYSYLAISGFICVFIFGKRASFN